MSTLATYQAPGVGPQTNVIDLSVIIVNWNAAAYLPAALDSVFAAQGVLWKSRRSEGEDEGLALEVWLIDNASTDDSVALVRGSYPQVQVVTNEHNLGFAAANNQGILRARGRYLLLLNPDTELPRATLPGLLTYIEQHPEVGVVGPRLVGARGKTQGGSAGYDPSPTTLFNYATFLYRLFPRRLRGLWLPRALYEQGRPIEVDWVSGACLLARGEAALAAGPLDERYFMYSEDVEWCRRIRAAGYEVICHPAFSTIHHIGGSTRQLGSDFHAHNVDSLDKDLRRRYRPVIVGLIHLIGAFGFLLRYLLYEWQWLRWRNPIFIELRDLWAACLKTSLKRTLRPAAEEAPRTLFHTTPDQPRFTPDS